MRYTQFAHGDGFLHDNEYMAHHYAYMTPVAEVREPESYAEAAKDANWCAAMEEEMHALAVNETWFASHRVRSPSFGVSKWLYSVIHDCNHSG